MQSIDAKAYATLCAALGIARASDTASNESQQTDYPNERRRHRRFKCTYIVVGRSGFAQGEISNISPSGLFICGRHQIGLNQSLAILIESKQSNQLPLRLHATVVRDAGTTRRGHYCYDCRINSVTDPNTYKP